MSVQDYMSAQKLGRKEYHSCLYKGKFPYLPVLESIIEDVKIEREENLGIDQIPLRLVVGTCNAGRTNAFADNFMPILDWGTEFSAKWASLCDSQVNEGIRDPIKVYEYMNKFYVLEGNKRVSVLKFMKAVTVNAEVIRKVPANSDDPDLKIYYEFMDFYKCTRLNDIYFSNVGSFPKLMELADIKPGKRMNEDEKRDLVSCYLGFRKAFISRGGDKFDYPIGDAFLRFIHIFGYEDVKCMTPSQMSQNVAKTWEEFELLSENGAVELKMEPGSNEAKKNILSYLLPSPGSGNKKLKVGFIYERNAENSQWCYTHELGRQYIEDTFGNQIETISAMDVTPNVNDEETIEKMIEQKTDLIFITSPAMIMASVREAIAHPNVKILNCSLNMSHKYIRTYYARMYEAKFLTGIIAGALAQDGKIGYIAGYPVYGTMANINAFALGAKFVNPRAKIYLEWSCVKGRKIRKAFEEEGISLVSDQDMITPNSTQRKFGLYNLKDGSTKHIAMPIWHWGVFYEKLIQSILSGSWKREEDADSNKALNYWWGMSAGVVDIILSNKLPVETTRLVDVFRKMICSGEFEPFFGELYDQKHKLNNKKDSILSPDDIITMDWLMDNVVGSIPDIKDMDEGGRNIMLTQGVNLKS